MVSMKIIETLNAKIDKLIHDYDVIKVENDSLRKELNDMKNKNDELVRNNQDMLLRIDSTMTLRKGKK